MSDDAPTERQPIEEGDEGGWWSGVTSLWRRLDVPRWLIELSAVAALFAAVSWYQTRHLVDAGETLPKTTLRSTEGTSDTLVDPDAERTLVYAWAPWCGVCSAQTGTLDRARSLMPGDVTVRSVVYDTRNLDHARESAAEKGIEFPVLRGTETLRERLDVRAFPTFYVLSKDRRVLRSTQGYTTTVGLLWRTWF